MNPSELRALFDARVRGTVADRLPGGWTADADGPVLRVRTPSRGLIFSDGLHGLDAASVERLVARAHDYFAAHGESVEWKSYSHDNENLVPALRVLGFDPEPTETVMVAAAAALATESGLPNGVGIREVRDRVDLERIAAFESAVWDDDWSWLADDLESRLANDDVAILVAEADGEIVSAAWLVILPGTGFAGLWGGSTREAWRGRGIYRALVAERARRASAKSVDYLWVDASDDSRPILERLGMTAVGTTTPWVWAPA